MIRADRGFSDSSPRLVANAGPNFKTTMRLTIIFFLVAGILTLTYWAWTLTPSRLEYHPLTATHANYEDVKKIMNSTDIEFLREKAIGVKLDEKAIERDGDTMKAIILLGITVVLAITTLVLLFLEIAARGRTYTMHKS